MREMAKESMAWPQQTLIELKRDREREGEIELWFLFVRCCFFCFVTAERVLLLVGFFFFEYSFGIFLVLVGVAC